MEGRGRGRYVRPLTVDELYSACYGSDEENLFGENEEDELMATMEEEKENHLDMLKQQEELEEDEDSEREDRERPAPRQRQGEDPCFRDLDDGPFGNYVLLVNNIIIEVAS